MEACSIVDFIKTLTPWLDSDYIRKGYLDQKGNFKLFFADGGEKVYRIDDCTEDRLKEVLQMIHKKGIPIEQGE